jgi:hypothetical protein
MNIIRLTIKTPGPNSVHAKSKKNPYTKSPAGMGKGAILLPCRSGRKQLADVIGSTVDLTRIATGGVKDDVPVPNATPT